MAKAKGMAYIVLNVIYDDGFDAEGISGSASVAVSKAKAEALVKDRIAHGIAESDIYVYRGELVSFKRETKVAISGRDIVSPRSKIRPKTK